MSQSQDNEELLREALLELKILRDREAEALRQSNAVIDGLARLSQAATPAQGLDALLASARESLACAVVLIVTLDQSGVRVSQATDAALVGTPFPPEVVASGKPRRVVDMALAGWWTNENPPPAGIVSMISAPIDLPKEALGALVCLGAQRAQFSKEDLTLIKRMAGLASQALSTLALAERNALLAAVIDGSSAGVSIADARHADMPLIYVNEAFTQLSGYSVDEALGTNCRFMSAEATGSKERRRLRQAVAENGTGTFEVRNRRKDGQLFWNRLTLYPVRDASGEVANMVATQVDITAEKAAAEERDRARIHLIGALSSTSEGFLLLDPKGDVVFANAQFRAFFETKTAHWHDGSAFVDNWRNRLRDQGTDQAQALRQARTRCDALFSGGRDREEYLPDGRILLVNDHATADGGAVSIATDITKFKATERILAQRAVAIDAAQDGVAVTDVSGHFVYMNPSHLALFGYESEDEVIGQHWSQLYKPEQAAYIERVALPELMRTGTWRSEVNGLSKTGDPVYQEVSLTLLKDVGLVCVTRDTAERRKIESERAKLRDQVQVAQRQEAIGQLAAGVAHDFNNLLSAMTGSAAVLAMNYAPGDPALNHLERIRAAGDRAAALVARLLDVGARRADIRLVDMREPFREATELLKSGISARVSITAALPDTALSAEVDATAFLQVVLNLGINARDAIGDGIGEIGLSLDEVTLESVPDGVHLGRLKAGARYARIRVSDTGTGIDDAALESIFTPYFSTKGTAGTGLGLAVVSSIVTAADGAVRVVSRPGYGSTFDVYYPIAQGPRTSADAGAAITAVEPVADRFDLLKGTTILVCDDCEPVAQVIATALENAGAETAICSDPRDALDAVTEDRDAWHLLVTDFDMPELTGAELATAVRQQVPDLPVLLCTALNRRHDRDERFDGVVTKPVDPISLIDAAARAIMRRREKTTHEAVS